MAYVALSVNVGSMNDPQEYQGMAHLLEHMIFRGSRDYPNGTEYEDHLGRHGGESNAFTEFEKTIYHFSVQYEGLEKALEIMSS